MPRAPAKPQAPAVTYGPAVRVALFTGDDPFLRSAYTEKLRAAIEQSGTGTDTIRFDGTTARVADVLDECRSFGLMAQHKLVIVENADQWLLESEDEDEPPAPPSPRRATPTARKRELVEAYIRSPTDGATLVLRAGTWRPGNIDKLIPAVGIIQKCDSPDAPAAAAAIVRRARDNLSVTLSQDAAELIVHRMGCSLGPLVQTLERLAVFVGPDGTITTDHVRELVDISREEEAWDVQGAIMSGNPDAAVTKLRELLEVSRVSEVPVRFAVIDLAKKLHAFAQGMSQGVPPGVLARSNWIRDSSVKQRVEAAARRLGPGPTARLFTLAVEADYRGKTSAGDPIIELETLVAEFASAVA